MVLSCRVQGNPAPKQKGSSWAADNRCWVVEIPEVRTHGLRVALHMMTQQPQPPPFFFSSCGFSCTGGSSW